MKGKFKIVGQKLSLNEFSINSREKKYFNNFCLFVFVKPILKKIIKLKFQCQGPSSLTIF